MSTVGYPLSILAGTPERPVEVFFNPQTSQFGIVVDGRTVWLSAQDALEVAGWIRNRCKRIEP